ncbi:hypothetical protein ACIBFB_23590 [Nocardiopsis sp. NPDC050513]|uniref:hypothetical protein n=1 Tax=Nocardiopsis sp. NPDC050513 TaxID=3364338 RepID=UPI0037B57A44
MGDVAGSWHVCHTHLTRQYGMRHSEANQALVDAARNPMGDAKPEDRRTPHP